MSLSPAMARLLDLAPEQRQEVVGSLPAAAKAALLYDWRGFWARPEQLWTPSEHANEIILGGRGAGKNMAGAQNIRYVAEHPELCGGREKKNANDKLHGEGGWIGIAGRTANDVNETMLYGPSGLMTISPPWFRPQHIASRKLLVWPNGVRARLMSGDTPESFRGPNFGFLWCDELVYWKKLSRSFSAALDALRHGKFPRLMVTTTPLPVMVLLELVYLMRDGQPVPASEMPGRANDGRYVLSPRSRVSNWSTYDNIANLASDFIENTISRHEGTEVGEQELHGKIVWSRPGAPWRYDWIHRCEPEDVPKLVAVVVAVDPTVSDGQVIDEQPCECGVIAAGLGADGKIYLLEDGSGVMDPAAWALRVDTMARRWKADEIVIEDNQGGALVETNLRTTLPRHRWRVRRVHATRDKWTRFGLVAPMWQAGKVHHLIHGGPAGRSHWAAFEHQITTLDPNRSLSGQRTDRADAATWAVLALAGDGTDRQRVRALSSVEAWGKIRDELARRRR